MRNEERARSAVLSAQAGARMAAQLALLSIILRFLPISSFLPFYGDCAISSVCAMLLRCFFACGFIFTHKTVRDWEARFAPLIADQLRTKRRGQAGASWYADETYIKVQGKWYYLYRAIDADGNLVDSRISEKRDMDLPKRSSSRLWRLWVMLQNR